jgi:hypothetical protein
MWGSGRRIFWRYNMMYISERCYESGGTIWDHVFDEICWCGGCNIDNS